MLRRRTRDRCALGVGGSYGQKDYWLGQLDPASPQEPLRFADSEPRVLKYWECGSLQKKLYLNWHNCSVLHTNFCLGTAFLFSKLLQSKVYSPCVAVNVSFADLTPTTPSIAKVLWYNPICN
jgi:hypothetical protein